MSVHRSVVVFLVLTASAAGMSSSVRAQSAHVADSAVLQQAIQDKITSSASDRAVVAQALQSSEAQAVADRFGLDLTRAQSGVATLDDATLAQLASSARAANVELSGGHSNTVVISTTTLLLVLIVVILLVR